MKAAEINKEQIFQSVNEATSAFLELVKSFDDAELNTKPANGGWTAAQVAEHVTLSNNGITIQLSSLGRVSKRQPDARVGDIKSVFLNFDKKLNSPDFILPTKSLYQKDLLVRDLASSIDKLRGKAITLDIFELIDHSIFGEISRYEVLSFVVFHTQRHIHQLKKIKENLPSGS